MNTTETYEAFRSDVVDVAKPYLWSEDEVWRYMNAAYVQFVRLTGGITDFLSDATRVTMTAGEMQAELHPSILRIIGASRVSDGGEIKVMNMTDAQVLTTRDYATVIPLLQQNAPGPVRYMVVGRQRNICEWVQIPVADDTAQLTVYRLPLNKITGDGQEFDDVADHHHDALLHWMKHLAYMKQDAETYDKAKSADFEQRFISYCASAKAEWERAKHKTRVVMYGGL